MEKLWNSDLGNGRYRNPILYSDYSDPDVICVEGDYYMVASSFHYLPGVPLLHSRDLVNWKLINYCVKKLPFEKYNQPMHGAGSWAPSIRYHENKFYVFVPLPDDGIFVTTADNPYGTFSQLRCLVKAKGWIDPCPLWDESGKAYLIFAYAASRCGIKHKLSICEMDWKAEHILTDPVVVYDGTADNPTVEGPKLYTRDDWYYILAPAGGVVEGWQLALRSRNIYGPYEWRKVLHQGKSEINGPHQGGYVEWADGKGYFLHFQDKGAYGRIIHLQPVTWIDGWPYMGDIKEIGAPGEPVVEGNIHRIDVLKDHLDGKFGGIKNAMEKTNWQWQGNPREEWYFAAGTETELSLYCMHNSVRNENLLWYAPNACTQMIHAPEFEITLTIELYPRKIGDMAAAGMLGHTYAYIGLILEADGYHLRKYKGVVTKPQQEGVAAECICYDRKIKEARICIKIKVSSQGTYGFAVAEPGREYTVIQETERLTPGTWTGARFAIAALNRYNSRAGGYADFKEVRFTKGARLC